MRIADGDAAREAIRGTTALVDGARLAYVLWKLDDEAAKPICERLQVPFERGRIIRGAVVKANDEADYSTHTYARQESGLLAQFETESGTVGEPDARFSRTQAREILTEVQRRFEAGFPFSHAPQAKARYLGYYLVQQVRLTRKAADKLISDWLNNGVVANEMCDRKAKMNGLKVLKWP